MSSPSSSSLPSLLVVALCQVHFFARGDPSLCRTSLPCRSLRVVSGRSQQTITLHHSSAYIHIQTAGQSASRAPSQSYAIAPFISHSPLETYVTCRKLNSFVRAWSIGDSGWFRRVSCYHVAIRQISCPPFHDPAQAEDHWTDSMLRIGLLPGLHTPSLQCTSFTPNNEPKARYHMRSTAPEAIANQPLAL